MEQEGGKGEEGKVREEGAAHHRWAVLSSSQRRQAAGSG